MRCSKKLSITLRKYSIRIPYFGKAIVDALWKHRNVCRPGRLRRIYQKLDENFIFVTSVWPFKLLMSEKNTTVPRSYKVLTNTKKVTLKYTNPIEILKIRESKMVLNKKIGTETYFSKDNFQPHCYICSWHWYGIHVISGVIIYSSWTSSVYWLHGHLMSLVSLWLVQSMTWGTKQIWSERRTGNWTQKTELNGIFNSR